MNILKQTVAYYSKCLGFPFFTSIFAELVRLCCVAMSSQVFILSWWCLGLVTDIYHLHNRIFQYNYCLSSIQSISSLIFERVQPTYTQYNNADKTAPCLTQFFIANMYDNDPFHLTLTIWCILQVHLFVTFS